MAIDRSSPTAELIAFCLEGKREAWDALVERYQDYVYSVITRSLRSKEDRQDVFQNVFLILYQNLQKLRNRERLASYLFKIARRECMRTSSLNARAKSVPERVIEGLGFSKKAETPETFFDKLEEKILVREALTRLQPRCRTLLQRLFLDDDAPSYEILADELKIPVSSIGPTRQRCLRKLRAILEKLGVRSRISEDF